MALSHTNRMDYLWLAAALAAGLLVAWFDLHTDDSGVIAGLLLIFGGMLGLGRPIGAWKWALALGSVTPLLELANATLVPHPEPLSQAFASFISLAFAFVGVYAGAWLRRASNLRDKSR